jgi:hypothetical protein
MTTEIQEYLEHSIQNPNNDIVSKLTRDEIEDTKYDILDQLELSKKDVKLLMTKLKNYRYVDELSDLREGCYTRWISLKKEPIKLMNGGILCEVKVVDDGVFLVCKNAGRFFQFDMATCLIFQKLTCQEQIILYAMDSL